MLALVKCLIPVSLVIRSLSFALRFCTNLFAEHGTYWASQNSIASVMQRALLYLPLHQGAAQLSSRPFIKHGHFQHTFYSRADTRVGMKHPVPSRSAFPLYKCPIPRADRTCTLGGGHRQNSAGSGGGNTAGAGPVRRQRHGRQEHGLQLARHAGDLRVLRLVGLDQPGELQDACKKRGWAGRPAASAGAEHPVRRGNNPPSPSLLNP